VSRIKQAFSFNLNTKIMNIIVILIIGALAGWLGSMIFRGSGLGLIGNLVVGILGGFVGYWLLGELGVNLGTGWIGAILTGAIGAIIILLILNLIFKKR
jgi:uncharacterized membrane protein YeaQ/YmgE (transglycosylase-associated protein family)